MSRFFLYAQKMGAYSERQSEHIFIFVRAFRQAVCGLGARGRQKKIFKFFIQYSLVR